MTLAEKVAIASLILNSAGILGASVKIALSIGELNNIVRELIKFKENTDEKLENHNTRISTMEGLWASKKTF